LATTAIEGRGAFHLVLAGGTTPAGVYRRLALADADWARWHVWFGDERCLPRGHADRNDSMAREAWLDRVPIPAGQVHSIPAERGPVAAATAYGASLARLGDFDLVLLGLGEDGHTASLFPGLPSADPAGDVAVVAVTGAPKAPPERVSLTARRLARTHALWFLVTGSGKREALGRLLAGDAGIPAAMIRPSVGVTIWADEAALAGTPVG
jgi:6-phosphogluconolactonase